MTHRQYKLVFSLAFSALPASAVTSRVHDFGIPGVYGKVRQRGKLKRVY